MLQPNDVILVTRNDQPAFPVPGLFIERDGNVISFRRFDHCVANQPDAPLTIEDLSLYTISLNVYTISSVPHKSGLLGLAETTLTNLDNYNIDNPDLRLINLVHDNQGILFQVANARLSTVTSAAIAKAIALLKRDSLEATLCHNCEYDRHLVIAHTIRSPKRLKFLILQKRMQEHISRSEEFSHSKAQTLIERFIELDRLEAQKWIRHQLLRRRRFLPDRLAMDLVKSCNDESVLKRLYRSCTNEEYLQETILEKLRTLDRECWSEFVDSIPRKQTEEFDD